jgi:WD40 repeat protein
MAGASVAEGGDTMRELRVPQSGVTHLAYTHDGRALLTGDRMGLVHWWDLATGTRRKVFRVQGTRASTVTALAVSRDARLIAAADHESVVLCRWDGETATPIPPSGEGAVRGEWLSLSPDGRLLAVRNQRGHLALWDVARRDWAQTQPEVEIGGMYRPFVFAPDGQTLAAVNLQRDKVSILDVRTGRAVADLQHNDSQLAVVFSPKGDLLATSSADAIRLWRTSTWQYQSLIPVSRFFRFQVAFHPGGTLLCAACDAQEVPLWDTRTGAEVKRYNWQIGRILSVAFAPDGMTAAAGGSNRRIVIWDVEEVPA